MTSRMTLAEQVLAEIDAALADNDQLDATNHIDDALLTSARNALTEHQKKGTS